MSPWQQLITQKLYVQRENWPEPVKTNGRRPPIAYQPATTTLRVDLEVECILCGRRRGLHRHGDEACPNPDWKPGGGEKQWAHSTYTPRAA